MRLRRDSIDIQLGRLAVERRTGFLQLPGDASRAIHLREGQVVYAESPRTPGLSSRLAQLPPAPEPGPLGSLQHDLMVREATVDAALDLLTASGRHWRFRTGGVPGGTGGISLPVEVLLAEVMRRQEIVRQMAGVLTADTPVSRNPRLAADSIQVSATQWSVLTLLDGAATPRELAMRASRSVFGTTIEVFRLIALSLLSTEGNPPAPGGTDGIVGQRRAGISFIRA